MKELNWNPILRRGIYCSSACGHNCTKADHDQALRKAKNTIASLKTKGWKAKVWENMGWHWSLVNSFCGISLHYEKHSGTYWCMMQDGDSVEATTGSCEINTVHGFKDPNKAVKAQVRNALPVLKSHAKGLENLSKFISTDKK